MPKFVSRSLVVGLAWTAMHVAAPQALAPLAACAADHEFPVVQSIGRFFGVGYTKGGYHAAQDGRLDIISNRHPSTDYRPGGLAPFVQPLHMLPSPAATSATNFAPTPTPTPAPDPALTPAPAARRAPAEVLPQPADAEPAASPSDLLLSESPQGLEAHRKAGPASQNETGFSIIDTGFPVPIYHAPARSSRLPSKNRYH